MKNKLKALLAGTLSVLMLAGCGATSSSQAGGTGGSTPASTTGGGTVPANTAVEISFWHHMEGVNAEALEDAVKVFNETIGAEKSITVVPSFQGTNTGEKLNTLAQANDFGNFPDVVQVASAAIPAVSEYEILFTPEEMYKAGENIILSKEDIIANNARTFTYKNELMAMPFSNSTILLYYNKTLFKEVGLDPEAPPKTIAEMTKMAEQLMLKDGNTVSRFGLNVQVKRYQLVNWIGSQGDFNFIGDNEGGRAGMMTKFTFGEDGSLMKYLDEWEKLIATGAYKPVEDNINEEFAMGLSAMAIMSSARISKVDALIGENYEWGTAALPAVSSGDKGGAAIGGSGVVMFDHGDAARKDAAWVFTQYLGGVDAQNAFCQKSGYIPMNQKVYDTDEWKAFEASNDKISAATSQLLASNANVQEPFDLVTGEIQTLIDEEMVKFAQGQQDKQTTHDNIVSKCNAKVDEYVKVNG